MSIPKDLAKLKNKVAFEHSNDGPYRESFENGFDSGVTAAFGSTYVLALIDALKFYDNNFSYLTLAESALDRWSKRNE